MEPQFVQFKLQSTPAAAESFKTTATGCAVRPEPEFVTERADGVTLTEIALAADGVVIVTVELTDFVVSVTEVAVSITVPPAGTADGAV